MSKLFSWAAGHRKALLAYAGTALGILTAVSAHYHWQIWWLPMAGSVLAAVGVHAVPNKQG